MLLLLPLVLRLQEHGTTSLIGDWGSWADLPSAALSPVDIWSFLRSLFSSNVALFLSVSRSIVKFPDAVVGPVSCW